MLFPPFELFYEAYIGLFLISIGVLNELRYQLLNNLVEHNVSK